MEAREEQAWASHRIRSALTTRGVFCNLNAARRLAQENFDPCWVAVLLDKAADMPGTVNPKRMVYSWVNRGTWRTHVLFEISLTIGLYPKMFAPTRFRKCQQLLRAGLQPWILQTLAKVVGDDAKIDQPGAYIARLIKTRRWVQAISILEKHRRRKDHFQRASSTERVSHLLSGFFRRLGR